ncbi:glycosyltransferase family 4 protein [Bacteroides thetaiotaomicron]|uniref:glycosyltransferase family 4 protein n=1 Tax=Bacteroides thetaiotaomicron TaxID=818 RepID=UPI0039C21B4E
MKQPYLATPIYKDAYIDFVNEIIKKERIDIVQNEYFEQLYMVYAIPNTVKKVFIQHEIQYIAKERLIQQREYPSSVRYLATMQRIQEINALNEYDQVITMTDIDKNILMCDGVRAPISASPSFIPLPDNIAYKECERSSICFIGGSGHNPNLNGVTWFLDNVWSLILKENPNFTFKIIGKWDEKIKTEYQKKYRNLFFCGFVDNLAMVISECIMVIPILIGSGIRMKILESVNFYSPFVTTTVGVEGLDFINGKECIIADEPQAFATGVLKIATDKVLQHNLTKAAHEKLMEMYSPEASVQRRLNIYNEMLKR